MTNHTELSNKNLSAPPRLNVQAAIHTLLSDRRSPRAFSERSLGQSEITSLFEAARWSPSSANDQPWYFVVATKEDTGPYSALLESLMEGNRRWAMHAPMLVLAAARTTYSKNGHPYQHSLYDLGQSMAMLSVQATSLGLAVHQMGGFDPEKLVQLYPIPEGFTPVIIVAIGYPDQSEKLPEDLQKREQSPRSRKPLESFVFTEEWGKPSRHIQTLSLLQLQQSTN